MGRRRCAPPPRVRHRVHSVTGLAAAVRSRTLRVVPLLVLLAHPANPVR
ncbi:hypothetical protein ACFWEH_36340 [Streptomyces anulatus]|nr:hypothetical protein [Streptomyces sp. TSRI0395]